MEEIRHASAKTLEPTRIRTLSSALRFNVIWSRVPELHVSPMRTFIAIVLSLFIIGCVSSRGHRDSFARLHALVERALNDSCDLGQISTNEIVGGRYFEVRPYPRGLPIVVSERQFFSQADWESRYTTSTNLMSQFMEMAMTNQLIDTNHPIDAKIAERFVGLSNAFGLFNLPEWHYHDIGVDVRVEEVDTVYPGYEQDCAEAQNRYSRIVALLEPYHRTNKVSQPTAAAVR